MSSIINQINITEETNNIISEMINSNDFQNMFPQFFKEENNDNFNEYFINSTNSINEPISLDDIILIHYSKTEEDEIMKNLNK